MRRSLRRAPLAGPGVVVTWTCDVCGRERPDEMIGVYRQALKVGRYRAVANVRYCRDRPGCESGAREITFFREDGPDER